MIHPGPAFLSVVGDVKHGPPASRIETVSLASAYFKTARAAERARRWLVAETYRDEARRLLEI